MIRYFYMFQYSLAAVLILLLCSFLKDKRDVLEGAFGEQKWSLYDSLIGFILLTLIMILYTITKRALDFNYAIFIYWVTSSLTIYFLLKYKIKQNIKVFGISQDKYIGDIFSGLRIILIYEIILWGSLLIHPAPEQYVVNMGLFFNNYAGLSRFLLFFNLVLFVPIIEEFFFRGLMYSPLKRKIGRWSAILLISIIFSLVHKQIITLVPILITYIYDKRTSIISAISAHAFYNVFAFITFYFLTSPLQNNYEVNLKSNIAIFFVFCLILFGITIYMSDVKRRTT